MFNFSLIYDPDPQKYLDYHKKLLKKAEQERLIREAMQAKETNPESSQGLGWLWHLYLHLRNQVPLAKETSQVHSQFLVKMD